MKRTLSGFALGFLCALAVSLFAQSSSQNPGEQVEEFAVTNFPLYGSVVSQDDTAVFPTPRSIRADAAGAVTVSCWRNPVANSITVNLAAGEFVPCQAQRLWDSGTDAITLHQFW